MESTFWVECMRKCGKEENYVKKHTVRLDYISNERPKCIRCNPKLEAHTRTRLFVRIDALSKQLLVRLETIAYQPTDTKNEGSTAWNKQKQLIRQAKTNWRCDRLSYSRYHLGSRSSARTTASTTNSFRMGQLEWRLFPAKWGHFQRSASTTWLPKMIWPTAELAGDIGESTALAHSAFHVY